MGGALFDQFFKTRVIFWKFSKKILSLIWNVPSWNTENCWNFSPTCLSLWDMSFYFCKNGSRTPCMGFISLTVCSPKHFSSYELAKHSLISEQVQMKLICPWVTFNPTITKCSGWLSPLSEIWYFHVGMTSWKWLLFVNSYNRVSPTWWVLF